VGRQSGFSAVGKNRDLRTATFARLAPQPAYVQGAGHAPRLGMIGD
jgi:hypothetical protein